ncbi:hypothetical protein ABZX93_35100 [Streptomyces sp. NPDC006632]|uniref:hypothetical protein n=1 Tax=Streptomyces sp. NPDC006632 TaxID=3157182 RepID=UPI0033AB5039
MPKDPKEACSLLYGQAKQLCESGAGGGTPSPDGGGGSGAPGSGVANGASEHIKDLANSLIKTIEGLVAPKDAWAPKDAQSSMYQPFMWLGSNLAVAIFTCVVVVCALTAWQGMPRLRQLGVSTASTLVAIVAMGSIPGIVMMLNRAVSAAFTQAFDSNESTLFGAIRNDLVRGADSGNPVGILVIMSALVVALAFAALVFVTRQPGILVFVCLGPLVWASFARGDISAVQKWAMRLLGLMFAPFALLAAAPFVQLVQGSLVMDGVLLVAVDVIMLRMVLHGVPWIGPRVAGATRAYVERQTSNPLVHAAVRAGVPDMAEQESVPRGPRIVPTPGRAMSQDARTLARAFGVSQPSRPGRLTTESAVAQTRRDAARSAAILAARRQARAAAQPAQPSNPAPPRPRTNPAPAGPSSPPARPTP